MSSNRVCTVLFAAALAAPAAGGADGRADEPHEPKLTPLVLRVADAPIPVRGSDGRTHVAYELRVTNFTTRTATIRKTEVLDGERVVQSLDTDQVAARLAVATRSSPPGSPVLLARQFGILYVHVALDGAVPRMLTHRLTVSISGVDTPIVQTGGETSPGKPTQILLDAPLRGGGYIAGDGCCDSIRHVRAMLPIDSGLDLSQRFAIDWERLDAQDRIATGDLSKPESYTIYGQPIHAVADGRVHSMLDGLPNSPPGKLPAGLPMSQADGNHVILDIGGGRYALFAHMKPGSVRVRTGERVKRGQLLGEVGTSGNSSEPHLHFHVMDGPSALAANGLPYRLRSFRSSQRGVSTAAFDHAIATGEPMPLEAVAGDPFRRDALPLDLSIVEFTDAAPSAAAGK